jgi:enamine deaminase RidA (YjgF/YER057c/UK114 family)
MAADPDGRLARTPIRAQARTVLDRLERACGSLDRIVKAQVFLTDLRDLPAFDAVWRQRFTTPPPRTLIATHGLLVEGARVLVDALAVDDAHTRVERIGSDALSAGPLVYLAGRMATDGKRGVAAEARPDGRRWISPIKAQTAYTLGKIARTLEAADSSLDHVVKAQVFLRDLMDFPHFDEVWKEHFRMPPPRTTVGVTGLPVPGALVAIDLIAIRKSGPYRREAVAVPPGVPALLANYSVAVTAGPFAFAAGQIASDYRTGVPPEARVPEAFPYYGIAIKRQARYVLENIRRVLEAAGASLASVVKAQVFLEDFTDAPGLEGVWGEFFPEPVPRTVVGTTGLLVPGTRVEIDLTALID